MASYACGSDEETGAFIELQRIRAMQTLDLRWPVVVAVAEALLKKERLSAREVRALADAALGLAPFRAKRTA